jgi:hypothetical protein
MKRLHFSLVVATIVSICPILRAEPPTTQPFTLYSQPPRNPKQDEMDRLLDELGKPRNDANAYRNGALRPAPPLSPFTRGFNLNLTPLPAGTVPSRPVEHWTGSTRPALFHITPNVVQTSPGRYVLHCDTPQVIPESFKVIDLLPDQLGAYRAVHRARDVDLIDDRPK